MWRATRQFLVLARAGSAYSAVRRKTVADLRAMHAAQTPLSVVTAWDYITGHVSAEAGMDIALVGDSLAMVALGYEDTNELELAELMYHVQAVARGNRLSFIVADVPFGSFEQSDAQAVGTAVSLVKRGRAQGVKIEGGAEIAGTVRKIVQSGVPVMGHVGLAPQKHNVTGGYRLQGSTVESALGILRDCRALQAAGVFAIILECVPNKVAELATALVQVPTIGIGAGPHVLGQVLVMADMLAMHDTQPAKFVKQYADFHGDAVRALAQYRADVVAGLFPDPLQHGYKMKLEVLKEVRARWAAECN